MVVGVQSVEVHTRVWLVVSSTEGPAFWRPDGENIVFVIRSPAARLQVVLYINLVHSRVYPISPKKVHKIM